MGSSGLGNFELDTKLGTWVHHGKACLALYYLMSWDAVCTAVHGFLHTFSRPTGQAVVTTDAKLASHMCAFVVAVPVGCRLHAPEAENFFDMGSSGLRKL